MPTLPLRHVAYLPALLLLMLVGREALAQNSETFGNYEVFYTVLNSTFIEPDIARRYGITRGKDKAMVNIAVRKQLPGGKSVAQTVDIDGTSYDLIHRTPLEFEEFREGDAIYYIAELQFLNEELRSFTIHIQPEAETAPYTLKFNQKLYVDE